MKCPFVIRVCSKCGRLLVANTMNFHKKKTGKWGLYSECKLCQKRRHKEYYENNKDEILEKQKEYNKEYYENNKDKIAERHKEYYENNKDKIAEYHKEYYEDNKDKIAEYYKEYNKQYYENNRDKKKEYDKKYREQHKDKIAEYYKEYHKQYYENNPHIIFNNNQKRRCLEENQGNGITKEQWYEMMEFFNWSCAYSGEYIGGNSKYRTKDHIVPLNKGGLNEVWNICPMYKPYNSSKHTSDMLEWYQQQEFYSEERLNKIYEWQIYAYNKWSNDEAM